MKIFLMEVRALRYDSETEEAWVLDKGEYKIHVSHDVKTHERSFTYSAPKKVVYKTDDNSGAEIKNLFGFAEGDLTYLSRADA